MKKALITGVNGQDRASYQEIVKNLEMAKITLRKEKPLIQAIDEPIYPLEKKSLNKMLMAFVIGLISSILCCLIFSKITSINLK